MLFHLILKGCGSGACMWVLSSLISERIIAFRAQSLRAACYLHRLCSILVTLTAQKLNRLSGTCWPSTSPAELPFARSNTMPEDFGGLPPVCTHYRSAGQTPPHIPSSTIPCSHVVSGVVRASVPAWCDWRGAPTEGRCVHHSSPTEVQAGGLHHPTSDWAQLKLCNQIIPSQLVFALGLCDMMCFRPSERVCVQFCV